MKTKLQIIIFFFIIISITSYSQSAGNKIYNDNNRYKQNKTYNKDMSVFQSNQRGLSSNYRYQKSNNQMFFNVNVLMNVKADSYLAIFNISQVGETAQKVDELLNERYKKFYNEVLSLNIKKEDIYLDMISLVPVYSFLVEKKLFSKTYNEVPKGFELQKNIHIKYNKSDIFDKILTIAAKNEIYDLVKVEYFVNNTEAIHDTMRKKAIDYMNKKIKDFKKLKIDLDTIYHIISENTYVAYPVDRYKSYQAFSGASLGAIGSRSNVKKIRKPRTMFYNKIPYHQYDIVINPAILEPPVQYSYSLKIKYIIKPKAKQNKKEYYIISPQGEMKKLYIK